MDAKLSLATVEYESVLFFSLLVDIGSGVQGFTLTSDYLVSQFNPNSTEDTDLKNTDIEEGVLSTCFGAGSEPSSRHLFGSQPRCYLKLRAL